MKKVYLLLSLSLSLGFAWTTLMESSSTPSPTLQPKPSTGETMVREGSEEGDNQLKREAWLELMHQAAPGTNWKTIEYRNQLARAAKRKGAASRGGEEILANGNLIGEWKERGSKNQAGSVIATEYDPETDLIYLISAGGTLWRGYRFGNSWEVINQDLRFDGDFLKFVPTDTGRRLLAKINEIPHYSEDDGLTWTASVGIPPGDSWAQSRHVVVREDNHHIYLLAKTGYWENFRLYKSEDKGESYTLLNTFNNNSLRTYDLCIPNGTNDVYFLERFSAGQTNLYIINPDNDNLDLLSSNIDFGLGENGRAVLVGAQVDNTLHFYTYNTDNEVFHTEDFGATWTLKGQMPASPWGVGLYIPPSDPNFILMGEVECYMSNTAGAGWAKVNNWGDYYGDVAGSLHADMMYFNEFQTSTGEDFILISNHGGLSVSYDYLNTRINLGMENLNVAQYYDVRTDPTSPYHIYAGSQDQGFQRGVTFGNDNVVTFEQVISGDYGHIAFSDYNQRMWMVYPGGWVSYYPDPQGGYLTEGYTVESDNETVWIPPLMESPDPSEDAVYLAGGNVDGGSGSYLIKLTKLPGDTIQSTQIPFDFYDQSSEGTIAAMKTSPLDANRWYVSTTNGRFFYSTDGGQQWEQTVQFIPGGHYLYGASIYPSRLDENTVYFAGSGYSGPAVYKSTDGGFTFLPMNEGMPSTLVFEIVANEDESLFFAATEAGPQVYVVAEEMWYDMSGMAAPSQTYWSVEYLDEPQIVRFGTYGRGIWDFQINEPVGTKDLVLASHPLEIQPNPATDFFQVNLPEEAKANTVLKISNLQGQVLQQVQWNINDSADRQQSVPIADLVTGMYIVSLESQGQVWTSKLVKGR